MPTYRPSHENGPPNPAPTSLKEVEVVAHLVGRLVMAGARMASVRVRPTENQHVRRATAVVEVEEAEVIPTLRTTVVLSPSRIRTPKFQAEEDTGNRNGTKKRSSNVLRCRTRYAIARG